MPFSSQKHHRQDFLFLGGHLAIDFANTVVPPPGLNVEFLQTWSDVIDWLEQAKLSTTSALRLPEAGCARALKNFLEFRGLWRNELTRIIAGEKVCDDFLEQLNRHLGADRFVETLLRNDRTGFHLARSSSELRGERLALALVARLVALFLAEANLNYLRRCANTESCVLYFYDTTKNHHRQWCSVAACGNRHKVAAFRQRLRSNAGKAST